MTERERKIRLERESRTIRVSGKRAVSSGENETKDRGKSTKGRKRQTQKRGKTDKIV